MLFLNWVIAITRFNVNSCAAVGIQLTIATTNMKIMRYIAPQQVPVQYGGLSREGEQEFTTADPATEVIIKPATKHAVEFPISE
ncbi:hypothetical protein RYX36_013397, partial [Vicia faba]